MPCSNCSTEFSSKTGLSAWFCCQCRDGPIANWNPTCPSCGHPTSVLGTGFPPVAASNSNWTEVQVQRAQSQTFSVAPHKGPSVGHRLSDQPLTDVARKGLGTLESAEVHVPNSKYNIGVDSNLAPHFASTERSRKFDGLHSDDSASRSSDGTSNSVLKIGDSSSDITESNTDDMEHTSSEEWQTQLYLQEKLQNAVTQTWNRLHLVFDLKAAVIRCAAGGNDPQSASDGHRSRVASLNRHQGTNSSSRRRRTDQDQDEENDNHDDGNEDQPPRRKRPRSEIEAPRLACLFFKRNPQRCRSRCCAGPGYRNIYHLKEHLQRDHRVYQCPQCKKAFMKPEILNAHKSSPEACPFQGDRHVFGINEEKWSRVNARVRPTSKEEQWRALYRIMFPHASYIPSPYYGPEDAVVDVDEDDNDLEISDRKGFYVQLRDQLSDRVRQLLVQAYQKKLTSATTDKFQDVQAAISNNDFQQTLDECIKRGVDGIRSLFKLQNQMKCETTEGEKGPILADSSSSGGDQPSDSSVYVQSDNTSTTCPYPDDWTVETTIPDDFALEQIDSQECDPDSIDFHGADIVFDDDFGQRFIESMLTYPSGNSILDHPYLE